MIESSVYAVNVPNIVAKLGSLNSKSGSRWGQLGIPSLFKNSRAVDMDRNSEDSENCKRI